MNNKAKEENEKISIEETRLDTDKRARDQRDYEIMLMDYIKNQFEGI